MPVLRPMLCERYCAGDTLDYPCYAQPKLKGLRCMAVPERGGEWQLYSRSGKPLRLPHIGRQLCSAFAASSVVTPPRALDGELYLHRATQGQIYSMTRHADRRLQFHVFDCLPANAPWRQRYAALRALFVNTRLAIQNTVLPVDTQVVRSNAERDTLLAAYLAAGYEGLVLRTRDGRYEPGVRSTGLLKLKPRRSAEFTIVGATTPTSGAHAGCCVWICETADGETFRCPDAGPLHVRRLHYAARERYIGMPLTVEFDRLTQRGVPDCPQAVCPRPEYDQDAAGA